MPLLINGRVYNAYAFDKEEEFERTVRKLSSHIFGPQSIYISIKKKVAGKGIRVIPDGYVLDMTVPVDPKLYVIENEIVSHDPYKHIGIQMLTFATSYDHDRAAIKKNIMSHICSDPAKLKLLEAGCVESNSRNIDAYLEQAVYGNFRGIVVIDEARPELHGVLEKINANISVLGLRAFVSTKGDFAYLYDTLYESDEEPEIGLDPKGKALTSGDRAQRRRRRAESDTIVVAAREDGFKKEFLGNSRWFAIRIGAAMKERIKYIAVYQVAPVSAVTYIAEIQEIRPYQDTGKYMVTFKGSPEKIGPIPVKHPSTAPQAPIYVKRDALLRAQTLEDALEV